MGCTLVYCYQLYCTICNKGKWLKWFNSRKCGYPGGLYKYIMEKCRQPCSQTCSHEGSVSVLDPEWYHSIKYRMSAAVSWTGFPCGKIQSRDLKRNQCVLKWYAMLIQLFSCFNCHLYVGFSSYSLLVIHASINQCYLITLVRRLSLTECIWDVSCHMSIQYY